jgi:hypothetical protein
MHLHQTHLQEQLQRGALTLFLGADLPKEVTGVPSRAEMARALAQRHGLDAGASLARVAQQVGRGGWRREFTVFLREQLQGAQPQPFHWRVVDFVREHGIQTLITTAYDPLLQRAFEAASVPVEVVWKDSQLSVAFPDRPLLIQLYGNPLTDVESLVITEDDHLGIWRDRSRESVLDEVKRTLQRNTALFLGYDLSDPDFLLLWREVLSRAGDLHRRAFAVWPGLSEPEVGVWADRGIVILEGEPMQILAQLGHQPGHGKESPVPSTIVQQIRFDYLPESPIEHGWAMDADAYHPDFLPFTDQSQAQIVRIEAEQDFCMDYRVGPLQEDTRAIGFLVRSNSRFAFYAQVETHSEKKVRWLKVGLQEGQPPELVHEDEGEYKVHVPIDRLEHDWGLIKVDLLQCISDLAASIGTNVDFRKLLGLRLRGSPGRIDVARIDLYARVPWTTKSPIPTAMSLNSAKTLPFKGSGKAWAVLVGVNQYTDPFIASLKVCVDDVTAIQQALAGRYQAARLLTDATPEHLPTRANILAELSTVAQAAEADDLLLFYFSGHGMAQAGESFLLARDTRLAALKHTAVSMRDVREIIEQSPAHAKVIMLDACHSGASIGKAEPTMTPEFIRRVFEEAEGMAVLASCKQGQQSWEWPEQQRSVFTYYLLDALTGQADLDGKGFVTVSDASRHVTDGVKAWAVERGVPQTPTLQYTVAGDIILLRYGATEA